MSAHHKPEIVKFQIASEKLRGFFKFGGTYRYKVAYGGRGGAKSWFFAGLAVSLTSRASVRILCCREVQKSMDDSVYQLIIDTIDRMGLSDQYTITKNRITNNFTGSYFTFIGLKNVRNIKSYEGYDICWIEEAEAVSRESWEALDPTIRKKNSELWISFNPRFVLDYTWQSFVANPRDDSLVISINYTDNRFCSENLIRLAEECQRREPAVYRRVWQGIPLSGGDMTLISDDLVSASVLRIAKTPDEPRIAGFDVARSLTGDSSALVIRQGSEIVYAEEWRIDDITELCAQVERVYHTEGFDYLFVDVVGVGGGAFDVLKKSIGQACELRQFNGAMPARKDSLFANLRAECWMMLKEALRDYLSIPDNRDLRTELVTQEYKFDSKNRYLMESKEVAKSKGIPSPNLSDAICMTFAPLTLKQKPKLQPRNQIRSVGYYG